MSLNFGQDVPDAGLSNLLGSREVRLVRTWPLDDTLTWFATQIYYTIYKATLACIIDLDINIYICRIQRLFIIQIFTLKCSAIELYIMDIMDQPVQRGNV